MKYFSLYENNIILLLNCQVFSQTRLQMAIPLNMFSALARLHFKQVFYQLISPTLESMYQEAQIVLKIAENTLVLKVPPTEIGFQFVSEYGNQIPCCVTAIYNPAQALVASEAGARYIAVYVNRATHSMIETRSLRRVFAHHQTIRRGRVVHKSTIVSYSRQKAVRFSELFTDLAGILPKILAYRC